MHILDSVDNNNEMENNESVSYSLWLVAIGI